MSATETVDGTAVEEAPTAPTHAVAVIDTTPTGIIRADSPAEILTKATQVADVLKGLIDSQGLAVSVGGKKKHVEVGAWQACGTMLGALGGQALHAETVWTRPVLGDDGVSPRRTRYTAEVKHFKWVNNKREHVSTTTYDVDGLDWEACVEVRTADGVVHGRAEAMVSRAEETWSRREDFALRSMAETRAESRAYRRAIGWIVHLAGYSPTPAEEMGHTPGADSRLPFGDELDGGAALEQLRRAVGFVLDSEPGSEVVTQCLAAVKVKAGGYLPLIASQAIGLVAGARKASLDTGPADPPADATVVDDPPASVDQAQAAGELVARADADRILKIAKRLITDSVLSPESVKAMLVDAGATVTTSLGVGIDSLTPSAAAALEHRLHSERDLHDMLSASDGLTSLRCVVETGLRVLKRNTIERVAVLAAAKDQAALEALVEQVQADITAQSGGAA